ncbi:thioredoxin family protein [uncultured Hyphomicrobium sp.]|uniref:thioredoxin family protein n=1 Tax=uncultured Hyphomicrobium sp. TaxID=194373 RepID=UPI0025EE4318|nr:thioredoxin family protein [uncultured Hyphomicrobium sp.]
MSPRFIFVSVALLALAWAIALPAAAAGRQPYDAAALAAAQAAGKSILVHVSAPWCPTCKAQKPILDKLAADPAFKDVVMFELDFDTGGEALRTLNARSQSTLIAFKGEKETGRSAGDTSTEGIEALLKTAL